MSKSIKDATSPKTKLQPASQVMSEEQLMKNKWQKCLEKDKTLNNQIEEMSKKSRELLSKFNKTSITLKSLEDQLGAVSMEISKAHNSGQIDSKQVDKKDVYKHIDTKCDETVSKFIEDIDLKNVEIEICFNKSSTIFLINVKKKPRLFINSKNS